jgi:7-carboxy-7-deazaguanine synthase
MIVNEIFYSIQGEGILTGTPSIFIRLAGCPIHCSWCDTKYAWDPNAGTGMSAEHILQNIKEYDCRYIVITGGEPMLNPQLPELTKLLKASDKHITIETAGIKFIDSLNCDLMSISPKLSNSANTKCLDFEVLKKLINRYNYQLKFIIDNESDISEILDIVKNIEIKDHQKVMLMPQAQNRNELIAKSPVVVEICKEYGFSFCQRLQIMLFDEKRGI